MKPDLASLRDLLRGLPATEIQEALTSLPDHCIELLLYDWQLFARDKQLAPEWEWRTWLPLAGRGWGKTRTGAEWVRSQVEGPTPLSKGKRQHIALIGETAADVRDVMIQGESRIIASSPPEYRPTYYANRKSLEWPNGVKAKVFSAVEPDQLRGPQFDCAWCDELAKWRYAQYAWDMLQMALRLGDHPQALVTTTPRPIQVLRDIIADPSTAVVKGTTYENAGNLAQSWSEYLRRKYEGTRLGRQELLADVLDDNPDALWSLRMLDKGRITKPEDEPDHYDRKVIAIDPPATSGEKADECGMVIAARVGKARQRTSRGYVLADLSKGHVRPREWAETAVRAFHTEGANLIIAERNNGGEMVEEVIRGVDPNVPVKLVWASQGKVARAEPVSGIYEQGRVHHIGTFPELEDQMTQFGVDGLSDPDKSPDRVDALVWAMTNLFIDGDGGTPRARVA